MLTRSHIGVWDITRRRTVKPSMENMLDTVPKGRSREDCEILCACFIDSDDEKAKAFAVGGNDNTIQVRRSHLKRDQQITLTVRMWGYSCGRLLRGRA